MNEYKLIISNFLDESSPATLFELTPFHINKELQNIGYAHHRMLFFRDSSDVSQEVRDILLYQVVNENFEQKRKDSYEAHMNGEHGTKQSIHGQCRSQTMAKTFRTY
mmetsp:Transcript_40399/g.61240  ORF Transcript_40399/g.61240 Transcript_40399/m.61240 type:complete len:107 (+) Transcript_40399:665-985(+)